MNTTSTSFLPLQLRRDGLTRLLQAVCVPMLLLGLASPDITGTAAADPRGTISGNVSNAGTGNLLEGARVHLPSLSLSTLTDNTGRYVLSGSNSSQLPTDPSIITFGDEKTGLKVPRWHSNAIARKRTPLDPSLWREDLYFHEMSRYTGTRGVTETVSAAYLMMQAMIGRTGLLGGARVEKTEDDSWGWVRQRFGSTVAQQTADPIGAAERDYADTRRDISGRYTKWFPSIHLTHDITPNLKARLSWSTSFGRPPLANVMPSESINENNETLTINNPSVLPQTAENWDASLEYYFEPVGSLSAVWFHKTIEDFFQNNIPAGTVGPGADNGYNGEYSGFSILTRGNLGTAVVQGWELSNQQQFTFLPGFLKGLGLSANYTYLETHGDWASETGEVPDFKPRTGNLSFSWRHRGFGARVNLNYTGGLSRCAQRRQSTAESVPREANRGERRRGRIDGAHRSPSQSTSPISSTSTRSIAAALRTGCSGPSFPGPPSRSVSADGSDFQYRTLRYWEPETGYKYTGERFCQACVVGARTPGAFYLIA
jgi:TonB-dependent receptor